MFGSNTDFSDADVKQVDSYQPVPPGDYLAVATNITEQGSKNDPTCRMYKIEFEIARGDYAKRKVFSYFIHQHSKKQAQDIGRAMLRLLCEATTGAPKLNIPQMINKPITLRLVIEKGDKGDNNRVKNIAGPNGFAIPQGQAPMTNVTGSPLDNIPFGG